MNQLKCLNCGLTNFASAAACKRCGAARDLLTDLRDDSRRAQEGHPARGAVRSAKRIVALTLLLLLAWHVSITFTSDSLTFDERQAVERATDLLEERGFAANAFLLRYLTRFRGSDSWWNRWTGHEQAYAATNFPFEVVTFYPDFYKVPIDDVERAAILLHESYHLFGYGEAGAFARAWQNKSQLGWTEDRYGHTKVWASVRENTALYAPELFRCGPNGTLDCVP
jgi:hypothetical protein